MLLAVLLVVAVVASIAVVASAEDGSGANPFVGTIWALLPPVVAIGLALITKEVYSSLFIGIAVGALLYSQGNLLGAMEHIFVDGFAGSYGEVETISGTLTDPWNMGILIFDVFLGAIVALLNKSGGSTAFGRWAGKHIKSRVAASLCTMGLGCLIFVDDYFNCLTVGSVMRPVTDKHMISRAKLSYLIDATAAPVCIIAPISSWAAAVAGFVPADANVSGIALFISTIPYNYYALLTLLMMICLVVMDFDFGPMKKHEENARLHGDLFTEGKRQNDETFDDTAFPNAKVMDLILPVAALVLCCVIAMIYTGGFFDGESFVDAFANCDASVGLMYGSFVGLVFTIVYYLIRRSLKFTEAMDCIPEGFKAMVPAILILALAWTLKSMTDSLDATGYIDAVVSGSAASLEAVLPAVIFVLAVGIAFATGTSWGTFGILIPIVMAVFPEFGSSIQTIGIAACLAGAVCGDHCSPISDTTIMASAGGQCDHINHVNTQLPYALTCAAVSFVAYLIAGFIQNVIICLIIAVALMIGTMFLLKMAVGKTAAAAK
jgi:Na+/H+ antiporter NhaC